LEPYRLALGVGNNEDPVPPVRGAEGTSVKTIPNSVVPARGKVPEHDVESASAKGGDVFDEDPRRPDFVDDSVELSPQSRPGPVESGSAAGDGDVLAREPATDEVDGLEQPTAGLGAGVLDVDEPVNVGPVLLEDFARIRILFNLPNHFHTGALETEVQAANSREETPDRESHCSTAPTGVVTMSAKLSKHSPGVLPFTTTGKTPTRK
jgi:hypothetical protein